MIEITGLGKSFGARALFRDATMRVGARDRVALVGPNGSGKTTLLEMIAGLQHPDAGEVRMTGGVVLGYLAQETDALRGRSVIEEVLSAAPATSQAGHRLEVLTTELAGVSDSGERDRLLAEFATLQERFEALGGYGVEAQAQRILAGLGFRPQDSERRTESLSGGWLMRVALAKLLLAAPDCLLLDEPTNHLDLESVAWLEKFLRTYEGAVLLVSHDRDFMNGIATKVVEIDVARLASYTGDYASFVRQRELAAAQATAASKNQARRVAQIERFVARFRYKNTKARQVQSRIKMLERMERPPDAPSTQKKMRLGFPPAPRSGRVVMELEGVGFSYVDVPVYRELDLVVERGQKIALVGPNGAGKSTLLKLLAGALVPQSGERRLGHGAALGYFAQHQIEALDPGNRVIEEVRGAVPPGTDVRLRDLLGRFLFSGDDVDKPVAVLSGGERTRLALAKLLVSPVNFLCLDEPTNHLDIASRDVLEDALTEYGGAMVLITHDRHLIRSVANRIVEVESGRVRSFDGDYEDYLWRKESEAERAAVGRAEPQASPRSAHAAKERRRAEAQARAADRRQRDALRRIEMDLERAHAESERLTTLLGDPEFYASGDGVAQAVREYDTVRARIAELESDWERVTDEMAD